MNPNPDLEVVPPSARKPKLAGQRFGRLVVIERVVVPGGRSYWRCACDCGKEANVVSANLQSGHTQSCGCIHIERAGQMKLRHGQAREGQHSKAYMRWQQMIRRCTDPGHDRYTDYGGRGIKVCERWMTFENFFADMGPPPPGHLLDRENNDGNYEPDNVRWVTRSRSARNTRLTRRVTYNGQLMQIDDAAAASGLPVTTLKSRVERNCPTELLFLPKAARFQQTPNTQKV